MLTKNEKYKHQNEKKICISITCEKLSDTVRFLTKLYLSYCLNMNNKSFYIKNQCYVINNVFENTIKLQTVRDDLSFQIEITLDDDITLEKNSYIVFDKNTDTLGYLYMHILDLYKLICINRNDKLLSNHILDIFDRVYMETLIETHPTSVIELFKLISVENNITNIYNLSRVTKNDTCIICQSEIEDIDIKHAENDDIYIKTTENAMTQYEMKKFLKGYKYNEHDYNEIDLFDKNKINSSFLLSICKNNKKHKICFNCLFKCLISKSDNLLQCPLCREPYQIFDDKKKISYYIKDPNTLNITEYLEKYLPDWKFYILT
jgi:hypothetical protein